MALFFLGFGCGALVMALAFVAGLRALARLDRALQDIELAND